MLAGQEVTGDNLELWDELSRAEESEGNLDEAADILRRVIVVRYDYRGANERYKTLQQHIEDEQTRSETIKSAKPIVMHQDKARYEITGMLGKGGMGSLYTKPSTGCSNGPSLTKCLQSRSPKIRRLENSYWQKRAPPQRSTILISSPFMTWAMTGTTRSSAWSSSKERPIKASFGKNPARYSRSASLARLGLSGPRPRA